MLIFPLLPPVLPWKNIGTNASEGSAEKSTVPDKKIIERHSPINFYIVSLDMDTSICDAGSRVTGHVRLYDAEVLNHCIPTDLNVDPASNRFQLR